MSDPTRSIAAIYERYHQNLYRFCFSIVGNAEDAQDALQNAMLKAIRALPGEQREIQLKPWLYRIAHNESIEVLRKRREESQIDPELVASSGGPEEVAATRERLRRVLDDLSELPERQRGALVMRELAGLGFGEIGEALGTSEATARQTVYEARLGLHQLEAGREMSCESVMRQISDADGRTMRRRDIRAHLRACPACRQFRDSIEGRSHDLAAIAPLPAAASAGILHALLGGAGVQAGGSAGAGAASTIGAGAGKAVATSAVVKSAATVAVVAALGVGAADRSGVVDVGLSGAGNAARDSDGTKSAAGSEAANRGDVSAASSTAAAKHGSGARRAHDTAPGGNSHGASNGDHQAAEPGAAAEPGQGTPAEPEAAQHGRETSAAHKATPHSGSPKSHGHSGATSHHSAGAGHGHSGSPPGDGTGAGSQNGQAKSSPAQQPQAESPEPNPPAAAAPEPRAGNTREGSP